MCGQKSYQLRICSLILLALLTGYCRSQDNMQQEMCSKRKPKNSDCPADHSERRWFFHLTKGCKKSGFCKADVETYDNRTDLNYFQSEEDCQQACMSYVKCPVLETIANGSIDNDGNGSWGTCVHYSCDEGYRLVGALSRDCLRNGTWSGVAPMCKAKCPVPSLIGLANMRFAPVQDFYKQGDVIYYRCTNPYFGHSSRMCQDDGSWSGAEPICELHSVRCPEPDLIEHGYVHAPSQTVGSTLTYTCDPGFMLYGNETRKCGSLGNWTGEQPICWKLTIEQCEESDHPVGIDITNKITKLTVGSRNIWIIVRVTEPNPFKSETPTWKFHDDSLPHGIELLGSKIKITTVLQSKEQEGNYTVRIGDYEAFFTLLVQEMLPPIESPHLLIRPNDVMTNIGKDIRLTCIFTGCPSPNVTWYHNGVLVNDNRRQYLQQQLSSLTTCSLLIDQVHEIDLGAYQCLGSNAGGNVSSDSVKVMLEHGEDSSSSSSNTSSVRSSRAIVSSSSSASSSRIGKRSLEPAENSLCSSKSSSDTVTLVGRVKREMTRLRAPSSNEYRLHINRVLHGSTDKDISQRNLRTIVIDTENPGRLKRNEVYILQGRIQDNTLLVYRHDSILKHTTALEEKLQLC